jgi:uncharacterized cofD-like protein
MKKVVVIGGGTGTYTVLTGLKKYPVELSAIVSMTDSGGSNRVLRDEFGLLPTSDLRQCMVALSSDNSDEIIRNLFTYRYNQGTGIAGMTFGNLFMAALTDIYGSQKKAIQKTCDLLGVTGKIIPVTYENTNLVARYENGVQVLGEHQIDEPSLSQGKFKIIDLEVFPQAKANKDAVEAILSADLIILGPGDLYTSIICNLVIAGIKKAMTKTNAKIIFVVNLMTKFGQTNDFGVKEHVLEIEKYLGKSLDYILLHKDTSIPTEIINRYLEENAHLVIDNLDGDERVLRKKLISTLIYPKKDKSDQLKRSLIRHDPEKLAKVIFDIF